MKFPALNFYKMENLQNQINELQWYIENQNAGINRLKKDFQSMAKKLSENVVDAWEPDLKETRSVVILEDFDGVEHNEWDNFAVIDLTIEVLLNNYETLKINK